MLFLKTREFIRYYFFDNFVMRILLLIQFYVLFTFLSVLFSQIAWGDDYKKQLVWEFKAGPTALIFKHGNITHESKFFVVPNPDCSAEMWVWLNSTRKEEVKKLEDTFIDLKFELLTTDQPVLMWDKNHVAFVLGPELSSQSFPYSVVSISLGKMDSISKLLDMKEEGGIGFSMTAPNDYYFDIPHEEWSFEGVEDAVKKVLSWCGVNA
jgi:hypothetical protein